MVFNIYVHDCFMEIGHSHALIEILRGLSKEKVEEIRIVSFTSEDPKVLFPNFKSKFIKVPFPNLYPILLKAIFFQIYTFFYWLTRRGKDEVHLSVGVASLIANIVNVQFVHNQWDSYFFKMNKLNLFSYIYKRVLFSYLNLCEWYLYTKPGTKIFCLSQFVKEYIEEKFSVDSSSIKAIYSGVNLKKFKVVDKTREELFEYLSQKHEELKKFDVDKPIYLFVGAYERKGLPFVIQSLKGLESPQLIIVGKPDSVTKFNFPEGINYCKVEFTKELPCFYSLADCFIFPTMYEPFGLVIIEAAATGMELHITKNNVGASEILDDLDEIYLYDSPEEIKIINPKKVDQEAKKELRSKRIERLKEYSWENASKELEKFI